MQSAYGILCIWCLRKVVEEPAVLLQTALDKADEAQKEMESIPEAPTLQEQRNGTGAFPLAYCTPGQTMRCMLSHKNCL